TMEFGRRLIYLHKYEKLALDNQLKRMEELQRGDGLGDVQAIAPVLKDIANDSSVMNVSRARALRLLASAGKESENNNAGGTHGDFVITGNIGGSRVPYQFCFLCSQASGSRQHRDCRAKSAHAD